MRIPVRILLLAAVMVAMSTGAAEAKRYHVSDYDVQIDVLENGDLRVAETIRYAFTKGTFTYAYRKIPVRHFDDIEFVSVSSPDGPMTLERAQVERDWSTSLRLRWSFPETDGSRTFRIEYIARGVLRSRAGANILDWAAVGEQWKVPIEDVDVEVRLPWVFDAGIETSPEARVVVSGDKTVLTFHRDSIKRKRGFRIVLEFPQKIVIAPSVDASYARSLIAVLGLGALAIVFLLIVLWRRIGRVQPLGVPSAVASYPDSSLSVAEAAGLAHYGSNARRSIISVVFDLARRGVLRIEASAKKGVLKTSSFEIRARIADCPGDLAPWDERTVRELEREPRLKKFGQRSGKISKIVKDITNRLRDEGLISREREIYRRKWLIGSLAFAAVGTGFVVLVALNVWRGLLGPALVAMAAGWAVAILSGVMETRSARGMTLAVSFRNYGRWRREEIETLISADPSQAASRFAENLPELALDKKVDQRWIKKLGKKIRKRPLEFSTPEWMDLRDKAGNPVDAAAAAVECFEVFAECVGVVVVY
ncbi:MAG: DUF2207 domain-containing protein, partial [Candidatus Eisenbacteria sp.]|nr:DUF2207 domain-containing protein [Candidatus Eisenbacteria bacterium]